MLQMWTNEVDYVIAESLEQAQELTARYYVGDDKEKWAEWFDPEEMSWEALKPETDFRYFEEDRSTVKTVSEWIDIYSSPRYFACKDFI